MTAGYIYTVCLRVDYFPDKCKRQAAIATRMQTKRSRTEGETMRSTCSVICIHCALQHKEWPSRVFLHGVERQPLAWTILQRSLQHQRVSIHVCRKQAKPRSLYFTAAPLSFNNVIFSTGWVRVEQLRWWRPCYAGLPHGHDKMDIANILPGICSEHTGLFAP